MPNSRAFTSALAGLTALAGITLGASLASPATATAPARTPRAATTPVPNTLLAGHAIVAGTTQRSLSNGWYSLEMESGAVTLYESIPVAGDEYDDTSTTGTWFRSDPTGEFNLPHDHTRLRLRDNGDLVLLTAAGRRLWHSGTKGSGAVRLTLHSRGNLALHTKSGKVVWSSHSGQVQMSGGMRLEPGRQLRDAWDYGTYSAGRIITLRMQRDGNLVHRCGSRIDWQTHTHVAGSTLRMYRNGALRVVTPGGRTVWASGSGGNHDHAYLNGRHMTILADGIEMIWYAQLAPVCP